MARIPSNPAGASAPAVALGMSKGPICLAQLMSRTRSEGAA